MARIHALILASLLPLLFGLTAAARVPQGEAMTDAIWKRSYHGFRIVAEGSGLSYSPLLQWKAAPASDRVLIVIGKLNDLPVDITDSLQQGVDTLLLTEGSDDKTLESLRIGVFRTAGVARYSNDRYNGFPDCPIMRPPRYRVSRNHPLFDGVQWIVANRPSFLMSGRNGLRNLLSLPRMSGSFDFPRTFVAASESPSDDGKGRLAIVADSTIFNNQMLLLADNVEFANNLCRWLSNNGGAEKKLLMVINGEVVESVDPSSVTILPPPPTREEVLNALKNLPPEAMLEFGNSVAQIAEDENMLNGLAKTASSKFNQKKVNRFLIFCLFGLACLIGLATYFWQKKLLRKSAIDVASRRERMFAKRQKVQLASERQLAASMLLNALTLELANRRLEDWPMFPQGLNLGSDAEASELINQMTDTNQALRSEKPDYWTQQRLLELEADVERWRTSIRRREFVEVGVVQPT